MSIELEKESKRDEMSDMKSNTIPTEAIDETISEKQRLFAHPFSPEGRICRLEFGLSYIIYILLMVCIGALSEEAPILFFLFAIPLIWFWLAQLCKRFHDRNQSGARIFTLIIPLYNIYVLLMLFFADGDEYENDYGPDPKGRNTLA